MKNGRGDLSAPRPREPCITLVSVRTSRPMNAAWHRCLSGISPEACYTERGAGRLGVLPMPAPWRTGIMCRMNRRWLAPILIALAVVGSVLLIGILVAAAGGGGTLSGADLAKKLEGNTLTTMASCHSQTGHTAYGAAYNYRCREDISSSFVCEEPCTTTHTTLFVYVHGEHYRIVATT